MSASPFRAPWVEMKYSCTVSPSRKLAVMGLSMMSPDGLAMSPRIPASWRTCCSEPRAPESAIMKSGLKGVKVSITWSDTSSVVRIQRSMILFERSPSVMSPRRYWPSICSTSFCARPRILSLSGGTTRSAIAMDIPARVAHSKPSVLRSSRSETVRECPQSR